MTTLGELVKPSRERALPTEVPTMKYVGLEHIEPQTMMLLGYGSTRDVRSSSLRFSMGDVLYGKMRPYLNKVWVAEFDGLCSAEFLVFPKNDGLNSQFLAARLNAEDFVTFANIQVSGERPRVDFKKLASFIILLPPLAEQERIVNKLNAALLRVERAKTATQRARERLQRYRAAVLYAATSGELSREWREAQLKNEKSTLETGEALSSRLLAARRAQWEEAELRRFGTSNKEPSNDKWKSHYRTPVSLDATNLPEVPEGWVWVSVDQVASGELGAIQSGPFGSQLLHSEFVDKGILAIGIDNVLNGTFSLGHQHRITPDKYEQLRKFTARPLDVVITVMATVGRVCVLPSNLEPAIITKHCYRITPNKDWIDSYYLSFALRAESPTRQYIFGNVRGQTRPGINGAILKAAPVALPPISEQMEIVGEVERRMTAAERLATSLEQQLARAAETRQSLLREAFTGHLVPQNPKDEPGELLLQRIHTRSKVKAQKPKGKHMPKSKLKITRRPLLDVLREHRKPITPEQLFRDAGFEPSQVDLFYLELASLRDKLKERKPKASEAKSWPNRAQVLLELKER